MRLTHTPTHTRHPQIVATPGGVVCCLWEDGQVFDGVHWSGDAALYAAVSTDHGRTWGKPRRITHVNAPHGWATHPKSFTCGSRVHLAWTDAPEGPSHPRAAYYMTSPDGGLTWEEPERLTLASEGESWVEAVGGTEAYALVLVRQGDTLKYCRRDLPASPSP